MVSTSRGFAQRWDLPIAKRLDVLLHRLESSLLPLPYLRLAAANAER